MCVFYCIFYCALLPYGVISDDNKLYKPYCSHSTRSRFFLQRESQMFGTVYHHLLIILHLQLLGVALSLLILLLVLNVTLTECSFAVSMF